MVDPQHWVGKKNGKDGVFSEKLRPFSTNPFFVIGGDGASGGSVVCTVEGRQYVVATHFAALWACHHHATDVSLSSFFVPTGEIVESIPVRYFNLRRKH